MANSFQRTPTTISKEAKDYLKRLVIHWQVQLGYSLSIETALSDLIQSTPLDAPYPTPQPNGHKSE